jgi:hypothetical protein
LDGGVWGTPEEKETVSKVVLYSQDGNRAILVTVLKGSDQPVRISPFFDYLKRNKNSWAGSDDWGGPGTTDVTVELLNRLQYSPVRSAKITEPEADESKCLLEPPP